MNHFLLIITAAIWGLAFVAQRIGMQSLDPFSYNAVRFALGALVVYLFSARKVITNAGFPWLPGLVLFVAASLQQVGIIYTTAGAAGFITGLYVVLVPLLGIVQRQTLRQQDWLASGVALIGMLLINQPGNLQASLGNLLVFISAFFWAWHVQLISNYAKKYATGSLAFAQFAVCALMSLAVAPLWLWLFDSGMLSLANLGRGIHRAAGAILYGGLLSVGVAYTLQIKAQKGIAPVPAAVILCSEGVFAVLGGILILGERLSWMGGMGMVLMLLAMLITVLPEYFG